MESSNNQKLRKKLILGLVSLMFGILVSMQSKAFSNVQSILQRDSSSNVFQEISILKTKNEDLRKETDELEKTVSDLKDQKSSLQAINDQIMKYKKLTGEAKISGRGVTIKLEGTISTPWLTDLANELFAIGAEAVEINGIRLVNDTIGFDTLPKGQILLNGSILSPPYIISAIGDPYVLEDAPALPGAILNRLKSAFPGLKIEIQKSDIIEMN